MVKRKSNTVNHIRNFRLKAGLSQKELSELLGLSQAHISKIERCVASPCIRFVVNMYMYYPKEIIKMLMHGFAEKNLRGRVYKWYGNDEWRE